MSRAARRVLLIGWDAADWRMIDPLLEAGQMPALASVMQRGVWGNLASIRPMLSPMLWTSIATGKRPDKHGILGFLEPRPDATGVRPVRSSSRRCKALWNLAAQRGLRSCVINWFASHPAEPVPGVVVSEDYAALVQPGVGTPSLPPGVVHPPSLAAALEQLLVDPAELDGSALLPFVPRAAEIDQSRDDRLRHLATLLARAATVQAAACHALQQDDWDLGCVFFGTLDELGHHFMPYHPPIPPGVDPDDAEIYGQVMVGGYRLQDLMLQSLLEIAGPDTTVVIVSDHGFHHDRQRPGPRADQDPEAWHRPLGIAALAGPGIKQNARLYGANLLDVTPTILHLLGLPMGADMDGRSWLEVMKQPEPPEQLLSWEALVNDEDATSDSEPADEDPVASALAMRHLADLGYLDLGDHDAQLRVDGVIREQKINLARALSDSRRSAKAIPIWRELAEAEPRQPAFRVALARCLLQADRADECEQTLSDFVNHPAAQLLRIEALLKLGRRPSALAELHELAEQAPDDPGVLARLGQLLLQQGQDEAAGRWLQRACELDRQNPLALEALSHWSLRQGDCDTAVDLALEAIGLAHHHPAAHYRLGCALAQHGDRDSAIRALRIALQQDPDLGPAHARLAELLPPGPEADHHALLGAANRRSAAFA